jgi:hypothetical protein
MEGFGVTLEPWAGFVKWAKNINYESKGTYGGTVGLRFHRYAGIEGFLGRVSPQTTSGFTICTIPPALRLRSIPTCCSTEPT